MTILKPLLHSLVLLAALSAAITLTPATAQQTCLKNAWTAFNQGDYAHAIDAASDCIDQFSARAARDQAALEAAHEKLPPTGAVDSSFDKKKVFDRWAVNDVATAYFVRGQAAEQLNKRRAGARYKQLARDSYSAAARFSYGRCWDPQGFFWSPSEAAADRILALK